VVDLICITLDKLLSLNSIKTRIDSTVAPFSDFEENHLLDTIKMPQKLHYLTDMLPEANYRPIEEEDETENLKSNTRGRLTVGHKPMESPTPSPKKDAYPEESGSSPFSNTSTYSLEKKISDLPVLKAPIKPIKRRRPPNKAIESYRNDSPSKLRNVVAFFLKNIANREIQPANSEEQEHWSL